MKVLLLLTLMAVTVSAADTFWLRTSRQVLSAGDPVTLTCHVPRNQDNRWVELGIAGYTAHRLQMEGENSPQTFQMAFQHVPCDIGKAYCAAGGIDQERAFWATGLVLLVSGCDP